MKTRAWCRFTEAFPQHWNIRVTTEDAKTDEQMVTVMHTYHEDWGERIRDVRRVDVPEGAGVSYACESGTEFVFFRPNGKGQIRSGEIAFDGEMASLLVDEGEPTRWVLGAGTHLAFCQKVLFSADGPCDASMDLGCVGCTARISVQHTGPRRMVFWLAERPASIYQGSPSDPESMQPVDFEWTGDAIVLNWEGKGDLWVDPAFEPSSVFKSVSLRLEDNDGQDVVALETALSETGEMISFGELDPREPGEYELVAEGADILIQDAWDPDLSVEGRDRVVGSLRERTEIFVRYAPDRSPELTGRILESRRGKLVNLVCNGGFEAGIPEYPPRLWNVQHPRTHDPGWPGWCTEDAATGEACLKFLRPKDPISLKSRPMRLLKGGTYQLGFKAKGNATHARVEVSGQQGTSAKVQIEPGDTWKIYTAKVDVRPGYCTVSISFDSGGDDDQVVWVDDVTFGYLG
jgi:hypothetical protein